MDFGRASMMLGKYSFILLTILISSVTLGQTRQETIEDLKKQIAELKMTSDSRFEKLENQLKELIAKIQMAEKEDEMKKLLDMAKQAIYLLSNIIIFK